MNEKWLTKECAELLSNVMTCDEVKAAIKSAVLAEREQCAKLCEEMNMYTQHQSKEAYSCAYACAAAIRARGEK